MSVNRKYVDYTKFDPRSVKTMSPADKTFDMKAADGTPIPGKRGNYSEVKLLYEYEGKVTENLQVQLPPVWSFGVKARKQRENALNTTFSIERNTPEGMKAIQAMRQLHNQIATLLEPVKGKVCPNLEVAPLPDNIMAKSQAEKTGLRSILFWAMDNGRPIEGRDPLITTNVDRGTYYKRVTSVTKNAKGGNDYKFKKIEREELVGFNYKCIPVIHFTHVYAGGTLLIQSRLASALILDIQPKGGANLQDPEDIDNIPGLADQLMGQIDALDQFSGKGVKDDSVPKSAPMDTETDIDRVLSASMDPITPALNQNHETSSSSSSSSSTPSAHAFMNTVATPVPAPVTLGIPKMAVKKPPTVN